MKIKIIGLIMFIVFTSCKVETKDSTNTTIKTSKINTAETKILSVSKKLLVTALNGLSIRDTLSLSGEKIGKLLYEDTVEVIEETNEELQLKDGKNLISGKWIKIKIPKTNNAGYAFGGFLNELDNKVPHMKHHLKYRLQHLISTKLPIKDSVEYEKKEPSYVLNKTEWQAFGFNALEQFVDDSYNTFSIYNVIPIENGFALFIESFYDSETHHWLCLVNNNLVLNDKIDIAYDNAGGYNIQETLFEQEKITVVEYDTMSENIKKPSTTYKIENLNFKKL